MRRIQPCGQSASSPADDGLLARSLLYQEFLAERDEILRLKKLESEKAGADVGFEQALVNWVVHHRTRWRAARRLASRLPRSAPTR